MKTILTTIALLLSSCAHHGDNASSSWMWEHLCDTKYYDNGEEYKDENDKCVKGISYVFQTI